MHESPRDAGLVRAVSSRGLAASIINTVVGAGIFAAPAALAADIGVYAPLAFLICALAIGSIAICFAEGGSRIPTSGGAYGYIEAAFGPLAAYVAGTLLWFSAVLSSGAIAAAVADVAASLFPKELMAPVRFTIIVGVLGGIVCVNLGGAARGARLVEGATVVKLLPLAIFVIAGAGAIHRSNFLHLSEPSTAGAGRALILALFTFTGMEIALSASGEIQQPSKTIPRALAMAMLPIAFLFIAIQVIAQGILGSSLAHSSVPLADAMARISPLLRLLMLAGAAVSMAGYLSSDILGTPRTLFAFAREGSLPRLLGRVHPRTHAPHIAIIAYAALAMVLAASGSFAELAVFSTLVIAPLYMLACGAAWLLARRGVATSGSPLNFRWLGAAMSIGIVSMLILIALASRAEILGLLCVVGLSAGIYFAIHRVRKPALAVDPTAS